MSSHKHFRDGSMPEFGVAKFLLNDDIFSQQSGVLPQNYKPYINNQTRQQSQGVLSKTTSKRFPMRKIQLGKIEHWFKSSAQMDALIMQTSDNISQIHSMTIRNRDPRKLLERDDRLNVRRPRLPPSTSMRSRNQNQTQNFFHSKSSSILNESKRVSSLEVLQNVPILQTIDETDFTKASYIEKDQDLIYKLKNKISVTGLTKLSINNEEKWIQCQVLQQVANKYLVFIPTINKQKLVTRLNLRLNEEKEEEHNVRVSDTRYMQTQQAWTQKCFKLIQSQVNTDRIKIQQPIVDGVIQLDRIFKQKNMEGLRNSHEDKVIDEVSKFYSSQIIQEQIVSQYGEMKKITDWNIIPNSRSLQFDQIREKLERKFHRAGYISSLKPADKIYIAQQHLKIIDVAQAARSFRIFKGLEIALKQKLQKSSKLDLFEESFVEDYRSLEIAFMRMEDIIDDLNEYNKKQIENQKGSFLPLVYDENLVKAQNFLDICRKKVTALVSSYLTMSIKSGIFETVALLNMFENTSTLQQNPNNDIFCNNPSMIVFDWNIIETNYLKITKLIFQNKARNYQIQIVGQEPMFKVSLETIVNTKQKQNNNKEILVKKQTQIQKMRQMIHSAQGTQKEIFFHILRKNQDEYPINGKLKSTVTIDSQGRQTIQDYRLGWICLKRFKTVFLPQLRQHENEYVNLYHKLYQKILNQDSIGSYTSQQKFSLQETKSTFKYFISFIENDILQQYHLIYPVLILANNLNFYLTDQQYFNALINQQENTKNFFFLEQELAKIFKDHLFLQNIPDFLNIKLFQISLVEFKQNLNIAIKGIISNFSAAMLAIFSGLFDENVQIQKQQIQKLDGNHNNKVDSYIELLQFTKSEELNRQVGRIKQNIQEAERLLAIFENYQILIPENLFRLYLSQQRILSDIEERRLETQSYLRQGLEIIHQIIEKKSVQLINQFDNVLQKLEETKHYYDLANAHQYLSLMKQYDQTMLDTISEARLLNSQQTYLEFELTDFQFFEVQYNQMIKYIQFWDVAVKIQFKMEIWEREPFVELDIKDLMSTSREYAQEVNRLSYLITDENIKQSLSILRKSVGKFEPQIYSFLYLKELQSQRRRFEQVMSSIFNDEIQTIYSITLHSLIDVGIQNLQEKIIEDQQNVQRDKYIRQRVNEYETQFRDIQIKSYTQNESSFTAISNPDQVIMSLQELENEISLFVQRNKDLDQTFKSKCIFYNLTCKYSRKILKKLFDAQELILNLEPFITTFQMNWPEYYLLRDEYSKRLEIIIRMGSSFFIQQFEKGEATPEKNFEREEVKLLLDKFKTLKKSGLILQNKFKIEIETLRNQHSRLSFLSTNDLQKVFYNLFDTKKFESLLMKLYPNIQKFVIENNQESLKLKLIYSFYEEEIQPIRTIHINWKNTQIEHLYLLFETIEESYIVWLQENIYNYLPSIAGSNYDFVNIYKLVQMHALKLQSMCIILQLQFYYDMTLTLYQEHNQRNALKKFLSQLEDSLSQFNELIYKKSKRILNLRQFEIQTQIILLALNFQNTLRSFLSEGSDGTNDSIKLSINSFEFISLPKFSLELNNHSQKRLSDIGQEYLKQINQPNKRQISMFMNCQNTNPKIALISCQHKEFYSFELQGRLDYIIITPVMQRTYFYMLQVLGDIQGIFLNGKGCKSVIISLCNILAKPYVFIADSPQVEGIISSILYRGIWTIVENHIPILSYLLFEIKNHLYTNQKEILIKGQSITINQNFRILGSLPENVEHSQIESYKIINILRTDHSIVNKAFCELLGIGLEIFDKFDLFWTDVTLRFKYILREESLPSLTAILKQALIGFKNQRLKIFEKEKQSAYFLKFICIVGDSIDYSARQYLEKLWFDEFKYAFYKQIDGKRDDISRLIKEYLQIEADQVLLDQLISFLHYLDSSRYVFLVGKRLRFFLKIAAFIKSKLESLDFQLIYFPSYTISCDDLFGSQDSTVQKNYSLIELAEQQDNLSKEELSQYPQIQVLAKTSKGKKNLTPSKNDWFIFDELTAKGYEILNRQYLQKEGCQISRQSIVIVPSLNNLSPTPKQNLIIYQEPFDNEKNFIIFLYRLGKKNPFFKARVSLLEKLFQEIGKYFIKQKEILNFYRLLKVLLNEQRKFEIATGILTQTEYRNEERRFNFDPNSLVLIRPITKDTYQISEALFIMALIYSIIPIIDEDQYQKISNDILDQIRIYSHKSGQVFFGDNLLDSLEQFQMNLFEVYYDQYALKWRGKPEPMTLEADFDFTQKSCESNLLSAHEVIRLNPKAISINHISGQLKQESQYSKKLNISQSCSFDHYMVLLMLFSGQKVFVKDLSIQKVSNIYAKLIRSNELNQLVKIVGNLPYETIITKIKQKADFNKQFITGLENKNLVVNFIIDDINIDSGKDMFVKSWVNYDGIQTRYSTLTCYNSRMLITHNLSTIPTYAEERCIISKIPKENIFLIYSIFKSQPNYYREIVLANIKYELRELIPSFITCNQEPVEYFKFFKGIFSVKSSSHEEFSSYHSLAQQFYHQINEIKLFYEQQPNYSNYRSLIRDDFVKILIQQNNLILGWINQGSSRREINQYICKIISHSIYAPELELEQLDKIFKKSKPDAKLDIEKIWKLIDMTNSQILEFSVEKLSRLQQIFKLVKYHIPMIYIKSNISYQLLIKTFRLFSTLQKTTIISLDLQKMSPQNFFGQLQSLSLNSITLLIIKMEKDQMDHVKQLETYLESVMDLDDQIPSNLKIIIASSKRPNVRYFSQVINFEKDLPAFPTLYELRYGKHFNQQTQNFEQLIGKNDRTQVYRLLFELEKYFESVEDDYNERGIVSKFTGLIETRTTQIQKLLKKNNEEVYQLKADLERIKDEIDSLKKRSDQLLQELPKLQEDLEIKLGQIANLDDEKLHAEQRSLEMHQKVCDELKGMKNIDISGLLDSYEKILYPFTLLYLSCEVIASQELNEESIETILQQWTIKLENLIQTDKLHYKLMKGLQIQINQDDLSLIFQNKLCFRLEEKDFPIGICKLVWRLVESYFDRYHKLTRILNDIETCQESLNHLREVISKTQIELTNLEAQISSKIKYCVRFQSNIRQSEDFILSLGRILLKFQTFQQNITNKVKSSYVANKYFYDLNNKTWVLYVIALYVVLQSVESKHKIKIDNATEQLCMIPWTLQQQKLYFKIFKYIDRVDAIVVDKLCLINFFIVRRVPFMMIYDDSSLLLRLLQLEGHKCDVLYNPQRLETNYKFPIVIAINPQQEFVDDASVFLQTFIDERSPHYMMEQQYHNFSSPEQKQIQHYLIIVFHQKPQSVPLEFIHINLNDSYQPSSHQRLLDTLMHAFKQHEVNSLIELQLQQSNRTAQIQETIMLEFMGAINSYDIQNSAQINILESFKIEAFDLDFNDVCKNFYEERQKIKKELRVDPSYLLLQKLERENHENNEQENDADEEEDEEDDADQDEQSADESETDNLSKAQALQPFLRGERIRFGRFMRVKYLKDRYFYPISGLQQKTVPFYEVSGFLIYMRKLLQKLGSIKMFAASDQYFWQSVQETITKTKDILGHQIQDIENYSSQFARLWFYQLALSYPKDVQNILYVVVSFKYMKILGQLSIFMKDFFLKGHVAQMAEFVELKEKFYPETLIITNQRFQVSKVNPDQINEAHLLNVRKKYERKIQDDRKQTLQDIPVDEIQRYRQNPRSNQIKSLLSIDVDTELGNQWTENKLDSRVLRHSNTRDSNARDSFRGSLRGSILNLMNDLDIFGVKTAPKSQMIDVELLTDQVQLVYVKQRSFIDKNQILLKEIESQIDHSLIDIVGDFAKRKMQNYKIEFYPPNISSVILKLSLLCKEKFKFILQNFLNETEADAWNHFAFTPVSIMQDQMRELSIPLPSSIDAQTMPVIEMLILFKLLKPAGLSAMVDSVLGAQIMGDIYFQGVGQANFTQFIDKKVVTIVHTKPIVQTIFDTFRKQKFKIFSINQSNLVSLIEQSFDNQVWVILTEFPQRIEVYSHIQLFLRNQNRKDYRLWFILNLKEVPKDFDAKILPDYSLRIWINELDSPKELIADVYQREIVKLMAKGQTRKYKKFDVLTLNSFIKAKSEHEQHQQGYYSLKEIQKSVKLDLKYNSYFVMQILKLMRRFKSAFQSETDLQNVLDQALVSQRKLWSNPYSFVFKFFVEIYEQSDEFTFFLFELFQRLVYKKVGQQTQVEGENEFQKYRFKMFKLDSKQSLAEKLELFTMNLPQGAILDLVGQSVYEDNLKHFEDSQQLMKNLNLIYTEKTKKTKITKRHYVERELNNQLFKCAIMLKHLAEKQDNQSQLIKTDFNYRTMLMNQKQLDIHLFFLQDQIHNHMIAIRSINEDYTFLEDMKQLTKRFRYILQQDKTPKNDYDLSLLYDPALFLIALLIKFQESKYFYRQKFVCERFKTLKSDEIGVHGLFLVNGHLNVIDNHLEDGNPYIDKLKLPSLKLTIQPFEENNAENLLTFEFKDSESIVENYKKQLNINEIFNPKIYDEYLRVQDDEISQQPDLIDYDKKGVYFVRVPIILKSPSKIKGYFYFKSRHPQYHWIHKNTHITN